MDNITRFLQGARQVNIYKYKFSVLVHYKEKKEREEKRETVLYFSRRSRGEKEKNRET
jgi:hypothetical protein